MTNTMRRMVLVAGLAVVLAMGAGCATPGDFWYETQWKDVRPSARTLENGPYQLCYLGYADLVMWTPDPVPYLTDEIRAVVGNWLEIPPEEVNVAHFAWWLHRKSKATYGSTYSVYYDASTTGKCFIRSTPFTDIQRELYNWLTWKKETLYRGENRKKVRFAYFFVVRDLDEKQRTPEGAVPLDVEYWVCIFDKAGNALATAHSRALNQQRVAASREPGAVSEKGMATVRIGDETVTLWHPMSHEEHTQWVIGGLLVEALNAMDEEDFARLDYED